MSKETIKAILWTAAVAVVAVAVVFRTPVAQYVTGEKKIAGVL